MEVINNSLDEIETFLNNETNAKKRAYVTKRINEILKCVKECTRECTRCKEQLTRDKFYASSGAKYRVGKRDTSWSINQPCKQCKSEIVKQQTKKRNEFI